MVTPLRLRDGIASSSSARNSIGLAKILQSAREAVWSEPEGNAVGAHVDALDQQLDDARLLGREQFVPERIELDERVAHLGFADVAVVFAALPSRSSRSSRASEARREAGR